jgi:hypothetical protein
MNGTGAGELPQLPPMPLRSIRIPDAEWHSFRRAAAINGESASEAARRLFREYVNKTADVVEDPIFPEDGQ